MTNICNLKCSFCPPKLLPNETMKLEKFDKLNQELKEVTKELAYHVVGDPLVLKNLKEYLDISLKHGLKVNLVTTANNINESFHEVLMHEAIRQINFSINSYNANSHKKSLEEYLNPIIDFTKYAIKRKQHFFINYRIWNLDESKSAKEFNAKVFNLLEQEFEVKLDLASIYKEKPKNIKLERMIFINFDEYFNWPSLENKFVSKEGTCYGLDSHFAILSSGKVVPCCLDKDAVINLGDINNSSLKEILSSKKVQEIKDGFKNGKVIEELCQKCEYRTRFDK
ncbi:radical SAM/SPASM domain-containing protein [Halarcobacter bivalviorum]|uniref:radical SAM/SPASM domain-containing protein n=1 Tax=Halarcobacter bivalviorum TaxID=663364 RepID=UPI002265EC64|nr:SPASM domain-containing protein [Halarcobacter bivalviorum]